MQTSDSSHTCFRGEKKVRCLIIALLFCLFIYVPASFLSGLGPKNTLLYTTTYPAVIIVRPATLSLAFASSLHFTTENRVFMLQLLFNTRVGFGKLSTTSFQNQLKCYSSFNDVCENASQQMYPLRVVVSV